MNARKEDERYELKRKKELKEDRFECIFRNSIYEIEVDVFCVTRGNLETLLLCAAV